MANLVEKNWDYTHQAAYYCYRPNYSPKLLDVLKFYIGESVKNVADIGAGTGNLTVMLLERGYKVNAVEPNDAMREEGIKRTVGQDVVWRKANGTVTGLEDKSVDWVTFGSSFNVMDRDIALAESHRILKDGGCFSCMWNHRDLNDKTQEIAENIIIKYVPEYSRGVRREDQRPVIEKNSHLFSDIFYIEHDFWFEQTKENYINAWRSVRNQYWDMDTEGGRKLFGEISTEMMNSLPDVFKIKYTSRCWTAQKR
ncbi:class I SAM-dependent methyltransferase [Seleniivibrio sp.]|uniref:class I SAM-dependent methyltransferase n=1 Tax=Seleniivibrio sp. TaxID=2898801 RepID=UPI0025CF5747|nr:class I SAM-dependent methyltransferase [Seleniivibrio sp.]MCD8553576.1 class I SAM-dependent methyltransferase [Seleniivibrio sp.]